MFFFPPRLPGVPSHALRGRSLVRFQEQTDHRVGRKRRERPLQLHRASASLLQAQEGAEPHSAPAGEHVSQNPTVYGCRAHVSPPGHRVKLSTCGITQDIMISLGFIPSLYLFIRYIRYLLVTWASAVDSSQCFKLFIQNMHAGFHEGNTAIFLTVTLTPQS